jgi:two-component system, NtrC family, sensor kinase
LQKRNEQLTALQEIGVDITSQLELKEVLGSIAEHANIIMSADFSTIFPYDFDKDKFDAGVRKGKIEIEPSIPSNTGFSVRITKSGRAVFSENAESSGAKPTFIENKKVKSFAGIPLIAKGKTVGILYVNYFERHSFSKEEQEVISLLANQAAVAIENARLYQEVKNTQSEIADKERILVLTSVAADFVHKMNNLAGTIPNWVTLARRQMNPELERDKRVIGYLEKISQDAKVILQEARRLQDPLPQPESIDVGELAGSIVAQMELIASPDIKMIFRAESSLGYVWAVKQQLSDALFNIIDNGVKSIVGQGTMLVQVRRDPDRLEQFIRIDVSDTGSGIPSDKLDKIFELGTTYRPKSGGMGYGLWRARNIVEGIDGEIVARSESGKGSIFSILLPVTTFEESADSEVVR